MPRHKPQPDKCLLLPHVVAPTAYWLVVATRTVIKTLLQRIVHCMCGSIPTHPKTCINTSITLRQSIVHYMYSQHARSRAAGSTSSAPGAQIDSGCCTEKEHKWPWPAPRHHVAGCSHPPHSVRLCIASMRSSHINSTLPADTVSLAGRRGAWCQ